MKKVLLMLSFMSCIESNGMNITQILDNKSEELSTSALEMANPIEETNKNTSFARVISMEQLFKLILKIPQPEFVYSVMVDHIVPSPVGQCAVFEAISDIVPPLSIIDKEGCQWKVAIPSTERTWQDWGNMLMDIRNEKFHIPLLKVMIKDFLNEPVINHFLSMDVKLQNVVNMCKHEPTLYSMRKRAVQCNNSEQFEAILDRIDPRRIQAAKEKQGGQVEHKNYSKVRIRKSDAQAILRDLYSAMQLDQVETENVEGFYMPHVVRDWSRSERVIHWKNWIDNLTQRTDIKNLLNNKEIHPDEIAQKYYIPILQSLNIEINWAKHHELMPLLINVLGSYQKFVDYENKPYPFTHKGGYDFNAPAYVSLTDYVSVLSEDLMLIDFPNTAESLLGWGISIQSSPDVWLSWLEKFAQQKQSKTLTNYYLPFMKFFASKMVKGDMFFGGGHTKFVTVLQSVIRDGIENCSIDVISRGYRHTDYRLLTLPEMIWDCCRKAEVIVSGASNNMDVYDVLMFLDKIAEISDKDHYLLGYNGEDLLKLCSKRDIMALKSDIKRLLWDSANPNQPQQKTYRAIKSRLLPKIRQKLGGA